MRKIKIVILYDYKNCETCGSSSARGIRILNEDTNEILYEFIPVAHCYDSISEDFEISIQNFLKTYYNIDLTYIEEELNY